MKKPWLLMLLALAVAAVSVFSIWLLFVGYVMRNMPSVVETAGLIALAVIAVSMCAALVLAWRPEPGRSFMATLAIMLIAAAAPHMYGKAGEAIETSRENEERRAFEAKWLADFENYRARIAQKAPFSPKQSQDFVEFVSGSNLSYRSLPDHSARAFAVLKQALDAKIVDPNARVRGKTRIDVNEEPLFVVYYNFYLKTGVSMKRVHEHEWRLFQMLIAAGANLGDSAAAPLREVVGRETEPYELKGYLKFK
jgi:hypothetical protein